MNGLIHRAGFLNGRIDRHMVLMMIGMLLCVYFSYHLIQGQRSLGKLVATYASIETQKSVLSGLQTEREALEVKVVMMRPDTLDHDLLEERIGLVLGYASADDFIVPVK